MKITPVFAGFDYQSASLIEELRKNLTMILGTAEGTVPGDRHFGINQNFVGMPGPVVQNLLSLEIIEKIDKYEPRVVVNNISFQHDENGKIEVLSIIGPNREFDWEAANGETGEEVE